MRCALRHLVPIALFLLTTGCVLPYYMQAARGQIGLLRQRVPIAEVIADSATDLQIREQLALVLELRLFAIEKLALPDNDSYTSYVDLGRDFVVWNVVAAEEFSIRPVTWCFPVAGCVSYRGYFRQSAADEFAARLRDQGFETFVGGSPAYSTLGHFDDPVLNTMLERGEQAVAGMLFHELAHQILYVKGDTELNESFAAAVEQYGVEHWLSEHSDVATLQSYREWLVRQQQFAELVARQRSRLAEIYVGATIPEQLAARKRAAFGQMRAEYEVLRSSWGGRGDYDAWMSSELNNAALAALVSYQRWVPGLRARLDALGPEQFYAELRSLAELDASDRLPTLEAWNEGSAITGLPNNGQ